VLIAQQGYLSALVTSAGARATQYADTAALIPAEQAAERGGRIAPGIVAARGIPGAEFRHRTAADYGLEADVDASNLERPVSRC
jgi:hypothetical protein